MAKKKTSKKTTKKIETKSPEKERFLAWFMSKVSQKKLQSHQEMEVKEYFRAIELNTDKEDIGKYEKAFEKF